MLNRKTTWALVALLATSLLAPAQDQTQDPGHALPAQLKPFWEAYWPAKQQDNDAEMEKAVREFRTQAEDSLDILLDNYCTYPEETLPDELRTLADTLDSVLHGTRFIERVRFVLNLDREKRSQRFAIMQTQREAGRRRDDALRDPSEEAWNLAGRQYRRVADQFQGLGDYEASIKALWEVGVIEQELNHQIERYKVFERIIALAEQLPYNEPLAADASVQLEMLKSQGYDPEHPDELRPPEKPPTAGGSAPAPAGGSGRGLDAFVTGSEPITVRLELDAPKKGLSPVVLPTFSPLEDEFLWTYSWIEGPGPEQFDTQRTVVFAPGGKQLKLLRDENSYSIDGNGDGTGDVTFTPSNNPQRIDVPLSDGTTWPLMVSVPADREQMFGMELNYAPEPKGARLRFHLAGAMKGQVQGEPWLIYDNNLSGTYGDTVDQWGDGFTPSPPGDETFYRDPDAVLIGKAKVAMPWSTVLPLADGFYRTILTPEGGELTLRKLDLAQGAVKLDCATKVMPTHILIEEVGGTLPGAVLNVVPPKKGGSVPVPAGTWQLVMGRIENGTKTGMQQVRIYRGHAKPFEVKAGETATLAIGAPYVLRLRPGADDVKTAEGETTILFRSLRTFGRGGEEYALFFNEPLQPEVEILGPDGKKLGKPVKTMRADISLWQAAGEACVYFPAPLVVPELKAGTHTFNLSQKSHPLLGGPFGPEPAEEPAAKGGDKP